MLGNTGEAGAGEAQGLWLGHYPVAELWSMQTLPLLLLSRMRQAVGARLFLLLSGSWEPEAPVPKTHSLKMSLEPSQLSF